MLYFHKVVYVHYLGEVDIFHTRVNKFLPLYNSAKIMKINQDFPKLWSQMYCHLFYGSQCMLERIQFISPESWLAKYRGG